MMRLLLPLTVVAAFAATGTSAGSAEDALNHLFEALDSNSDGTLTRSNFARLRNTMGDPQTWRNFDQSSVTALKQHLAENAPEMAKRARNITNSITYDQFKYLTVLSNGGRAVAESKALLGIMGGILLMCVFL